MRRPSRLLLGSPRPPSWVGLCAGALAVAASTLVIFPLKRVAPAVSLGVIYMLAVLVISIVWGRGLGALVAVASALAFGFFHLPPEGQVGIRGSGNVVAL